MVTGIVFLPDLLFAFKMTDTPKKSIYLPKLGIFVSVLFLLSVRGLGQELYFPSPADDNWEMVSPATLGWNTDRLDDLYSYLDSINTKAFIVLVDGRIALEYYFGSFTADSLWYWASAGKTLTAFLVGLAGQQGLLSIDDRSADYLGEGWTGCSREQEDRITIRHQLTMTTGLDDGVEDHYCTLDTCLVYLADPGTRWAYHNGPYTMLDGVLEQATGKSVNLFMSQQLSASTGISGLFVKMGYNNVFVSKARSMARFGLLLLGRGRWDQTDVLTDTEYFDAMVNSSQELNLSYGFLTWLNGKASFMVPGLQFVFSGSYNPDAPADMFSAMGKNGQFLNVVPSKNMVLVRMGDAPDNSEVPFLYNDTIWIRMNSVMESVQHVPGTESERFNFHIQQDPGTGEAFVLLPADELFLITVIDISGRVLLSTYANGKFSLDIPGLNSGFCLVRVAGRSGTAVQKFIPFK